MNNRDRIIQDIVENCASLTVADLEALAPWQLDAIDATDCNWCDDFADVGFESYEQAISAALYATFEQVTNKYATPDHY